MCHARTVEHRVKKLSSALQRFGGLRKDSMVEVWGDGRMDISGCEAWPMIRVKMQWRILNCPRRDGKGWRSEHGCQGTCAIGSRKWPCSTVHTEQKHALLFGIVILVSEVEDDSWVGPIRKPEGKQKRKAFADVVTNLF